MSVEVRYHVIRDGKEVAMYTTKKEADEHDKMLNIAENLAEFIEEAEAIQLDENVLEELTIYLAKHRDRALTILRGVKPKPAPKQPVERLPDKETGKEKAPMKGPVKEPAKAKGKKSKRKSKAA